MLLSSYGFSQTETSPSLGDVARQSSAAHKAADRAKPKKVLDNEDLQQGKGPIPDVAILQPENSRQILDAIFLYSTTHTAQETEAAIHEWYDGEMALARAEMAHNITISQDRASVTSANSLSVEQYEDYRQYRSDTQQRDLSDLRTIADNQAAIAKIMTALRKVKDELKREKHYDFAWFDTDYPQGRMVPMTSRP